MNTHRSTSEDKFNFDSTREYTKDSRDWLRNRIQKLKKDSAIRPKLAGEYLETLFAKEGLTANKFFNFMSKGTGLGEELHKCIVEYLWQNKWATNLYEKEKMAHGPDALFHALSNYLDISDQSLLNLEKETPGLYALWRRAVHVPGKFIKGFIKIYQNESERSVRMLEIQAHKGNDGTTAIREEFEGFIVKKSGHYIVIARQKDGHHGPPRLTIIHNVVFEGKKIVVMEGMVTGCYGANSLYSMPVYMERVTCSEEELLNQVSITSEIPESIIPKLDFKLKDGIIRF